MLHYLVKYSAPSLTYYKWPTDLIYAPVNIKIITATVICVCVFQSASKYFCIWRPRTRPRKYVLEVCPELTTENFLNTYFISAIQSKHEISTYKNNKRTLVQWLNERHSASQTQPGKNLLNTNIQFVTLIQIHKNTIVTLLQFSSPG